MNPCVSILIPCFNAERWIAPAIESALAQSWPEKEVVVMDDGSTDGSLAVIKGFGDRIRWETGPNRGGNVARNRLLELARGDWLQYLDADDYLLPGKIAKEVQFLSGHADAEILFSPFILEHWTDGVPAISHTLVPEPHDSWVLLARWFLPGTGSGIWQRQAVVDVGGWNERQPCCQEHELYLRLLMAGRKFKHCPGGGYVYRQWSEQTVCKRNKPEVHRRRLEIIQRAEDFLRERHELTPERRHAVNQSRFEVARAAWQHDRNYACEIMGTVRHAQPGFFPERGAAAPRRYQFVYRLLGFRAAEYLADLKRNQGPGSS